MLEFNFFFKSHPISFRHRWNKFLNQNMAHLPTFLRLNASAWQIYISWLLNTLWLTLKDRACFLISHRVEPVISARSVSSDKWVVNPKRKYFRCKWNQGKVCFLTRWHTHWEMFKSFLSNKCILSELAASQLKQNECLNTKTLLQKLSRNVALSRGQVVLKYLQFAMVANALVTGIFPHCYLN